MFFGIAGPAGWSDEPIAEYPTKGSFISDLDLFHGQEWYQSSYSVGKTHFMNTAFSPKNIVDRPSGKGLQIYREPIGHNGTTGAEAQRKGRYGYGRYEVVMRPATGSGLVSSFFTYTGSYFGTAHDEIDIEFLGNDTNQLSLNLFADGQPLVPAKTVELPFDASQSFNLYAFEWSPKSVTWFVNSELVFSVSAIERALPTTPGKLMANIWTGDEFFESWHGPPLFDEGASAIYKCISFQALGDISTQCSDRFALD